MGTVIYIHIVATIHTSSDGLFWVLTGGTLLTVLLTVHAALTIHAAPSHVSQERSMSHAACCQNNKEICTMGLPVRTTDRAQDYPSFEVRYVSVSLSVCLSVGVICR